MTITEQGQSGQYRVALDQAERQMVAAMARHLSPPSGGQLPLAAFQDIIRTGWDIRVRALQERIAVLRQKAWDAATPAQRAVADAAAVSAKDAAIGFESGL